MTGLGKILVEKRAPEAAAGIGQKRIDLMTFDRSYN